MIITAMQIIDPTFKSSEKIQHQPKLAVLNVEADSAVWDCVKDYLTQTNLKVEPVQVTTFSEAFQAGMQIINYENWQAYGTLTESGKISPDVQQRLLNAAKTTLEQVRQAEDVKARFTQEIDELLEQYDVLILPTLPQIPPRVAEAENTVAFLNLTALVRPFNLSGHPALNIPLQTMTGMPVGLQLVGRKNADEQLCAVADFIIKAAH